MVEQECQRWASKGINITYQIRENRTGYKAGALKEGLKRSYVKHCEYVAIFDADFRPEPDFLRRSIPFLVNNPDIALVQARLHGKLAKGMGPQEEPTNHGGVDPICPKPPFLHHCSWDPSLRI
ncbi:hypothetical protein Godav_015496 [Gossypium davidsonii]|uniref:Glycosyltransferase 2-like domain-containing protein n=1 Tax=Gossypium davidsonii TaxID=34287 RepID=A0A7J8RNU2_GOSDV|nr:hypothetical protein [Gossypium davidsonii]